MKLAVPLLAVAIWGLAGPHVRGASDDGLQVKVGDTVEITRSHGHCWFPTVHQFRSGTILVSMAMSPDQIDSESAWSAYCLSQDGGKTWSRRYTLGLGANQDGAWSEVPDRDDAIWQFASYSEPMKEGDRTTFAAPLTKFSRNGRLVCEDKDAFITLLDPAYMNYTWLFDYRFDRKNPTPDTKIERQFSGRAWGNIVQGPDGAFYCGAYYNTVAEGERGHYEIEHSANPRRYIRDVLLRSSDGGHHWKEISVIASAPFTGRPEWMGNEGANEGSLAFLPDGRLYAVYRTGKDGTIGNSWSADNGKTWTAPASTGIVGVAPRIHRLKNGVLALSTGRPGPVVLWFNLDGTGKKWSHPVTIFEEMSTRYTDLAEIAPGKLLVVYDSVPYGWYDIPFADRDTRNRILGTFVDVSLSRDKN